MKKMSALPMPLVILYTITALTSLILTNKLIVIHGYVISACLLAFPMIFFLGDITAEIYGYLLAKKILWQTLFAAFLFSCFISITLLIPTPVFQNNNQSFINVFGMSVRFTAAGVFAIWVGGIINAYVLARWKIIAKGRYFWLRSIGSSAIGEFVNSLVAFPLGFLGHLSFANILNMMIVSYVVKMIYAAIAAYPGQLVVNYIKVVKGIDYQASSVKFNPFAKIDDK